MSVPADTARRRAEIARRLKAARWLRGGVEATGRGSTGWRVRELSAKDLAARPPLAENGWTADKIGRIERMDRHCGPAELHTLATALGLPRLFDSIGDPMADDLVEIFSVALPAGSPSPPDLPDESTQGQSDVRLAPQPPAEGPR